MIRYSSFVVSRCHKDTKSPSQFFCVFVPSWQLLLIYDSRSTIHCSIFSTYKLGANAVKKNHAFFCESAFIIADNYKLPFA